MKVSKKLYLLASPRLLHNDTVVTFNRRRSFFLLAYLALEKGPHTREEVAKFIWPTATLAKARTSLRSILAELRKHLGPDAIEADKEILGLAPDFPLWLDVKQFQAAFSQSIHHTHTKMILCTKCAQILSKCVYLYQGPFMAPFTLPGSPAYELWQTRWHQKLTGQLEIALSHLIQYHLARNQVEEALTYALHWVKVDKSNEDAYRQLMLLRQMNGQQTLALHHYLTLHETLKTELGISPERETVALYKTIRTTQRKSILAKQPPNAVNFPPQNLPPQQNVLLGRDNEIKEIIERLEKPQCRLLTITGPGGIGKSRLMIEVGRIMLSLFPDGVYFVPLTSIKNPDLLIASIAAALNFEFHGQENEQRQLLHYLREKELLLLLDNFDYLAASAGVLSVITTKIPGVKIIVTSRISLNLQEEWLYEIEGLFYPREKEKDHKSDTYSAGKLFLERASRIKARFGRDEIDHHAIGDICQLVNGVPLALELAATWTKVLSCAEIAQEIRSSLDFLTSNQKYIPSRHRSLRAVFVQSWRLLTKREKIAFPRLTVFRNGFNRQAAEQVAGVTLDILASLVDKSFLSHQSSGRYGIHEIMHQYGQEILQEAGELHFCQQQHSIYFNRLIQKQLLDSPDLEQNVALAKINIEIDNIRQAWQFATSHSSAKELGRFSLAMYQFFELRNWFQEGENTFSQAIAKVEARKQESKELNRVLWEMRTYHSVFLHQLGHYDEAQKQLERCLEKFQEYSCTKNIALCLSLLGGVIDSKGQHTTALQLHEESLSIYRQLEDPKGTAIQLKYIGRIVRVLGDNKMAADYLRQALDIIRTEKLQHVEADILRLLSVVLATSGNHVEAAEFAEKSRQLFKLLGDRVGETMALVSRAVVFTENGDYLNAEIYYLQALEIRQSIGDLEGLGIIYGNLGISSLLQSDFQKSKGYLESAITIFDELGNIGSKIQMLLPLSNLYYLYGQYEPARAYSQIAMRNAGEIGEEHLLCMALTQLGLVLIAEGELTEAQEIVSNALSLRQKLGPTKQLIEPLAASAHLLFLLGDLDQASLQANHILKILHNSPMEKMGNLESLSVIYVYLVCYHILSTKEDPSAYQILRTGYELLQARGGRIQDRDLKRAYFEEIVPHRELVNAYIMYESIISALDHENKNILDKVNRSGHFGQSVRY